MNKELPIRLKVELIRNLKELMICLHQKKNSEAKRVSEEIKKVALFLSEEIQGDVLRFVEAVQFQEKYDPVITKEVQEQADRLIEDLGFLPPRD